jgi:hypothetical protein
MKYINFDQSFIKFFVEFLYLGFHAYNEVHKYNELYLYVNKTEWELEVPEKWNENTNFALSNSDSTKVGLGDTELLEEETLTEGQNTCYLELEKLQGSGHTFFSRNLNCQDHFTFLGSKLARDGHVRQHITSCTRRWSLTYIGFELKLSNRGRQRQPRPFR